MRVLIAAGGSHGDILPFIALGREFQRNGHEVRFYAHGYFAAAVRPRNISQSYNIPISIIPFAVSKSLPIWLIAGEESCLTS